MKRVLFMLYYYCIVLLYFHSTLSKWNYYALSVALKFISSVWKYNFFMLDRLKSACAELPTLPIGVNKPNIFLGISHPLALYHNSAHNFLQLFSWLFCRGLTDESEILKFLQHGTLVGLLPVPHPILIRKYQANSGTTMWFRTYLWGVIYLR